MKTFVILLFLMQSSLLFGQRNLGLKIGVNEKYSPLIFNGNSFLRTDLCIGAIIPLKNKGNIEAGLIFQLRGNFYVSSKDYGNYPIVKNFSFISQQIGLIINYFFNVNQQIFFPYIGLKALHEIEYSYDEYMQVDEFGFDVSPEIDTYSSSPYGPLVEEYYANFYRGTPIVICLLGGFEIKLLKHFRFNFGIGLGFRKLTYKYLNWYKGDDYKKLLGKRPINSKVFPIFNVKIGFSYSIPFHKNPKTE